MVRGTIHHHNLSILATHPPGPRSKDAILKFLANFNLNQRSVYIRGQHYLITPGIVAKVLKCGKVLQFDEKAGKDWIKKYANEATIKELGKSICLPGQVKWLGKKDKFPVALSIADLKDAYKAWVNS